ncbi:MAG: 2TM domain-containing protein [Nitrososphaerota archaeon]
MPEEITLEEYKKAFRDMEMEDAKRGFIAHLITYILVNAMLVVINLVYTREVIWFFFPLIGWGIGLIFHYIGATYWLRRELLDKEAKAEYRARMAKRKT